MLSPFLSACEFSQIRVIHDLLFCLFELYLLDLICPSPGVTWNFLPVHWLTAYLSSILSWVRLMIGISCIFLKSFFWCVFFYCQEWFNIWSSLRAPFIWALHRSTNHRLWPLRLLQHQGVGTFSLREKTIPTLVGWTLIWNLNGWVLKWFERGFFP